MKKLTEYIKENVINTTEFGKNNFGVSGQAVYDKIINRITPSGLLFFPRTMPIILCFILCIRLKIDHFSPYLYKLHNR